MATRFSVLIPTHNREEYVRQAIDSVLSQTFTDYEVFVIDDGSTDRTPELLRSYGDRIRALRQPNQGPEAARNRAAAQASGEYLAFLDSDDLLLPGALEAYDRIIRTLDSPPLMIGAMIYFEDQPPPARAPEARATLEVWNYPDFLDKRLTVGLSNSRIVIRRSVFEEVGGLRHSTPQTFHLDDFNLVLKVGTYGPCAIVKTPPTVAYRSHTSNSIRGVESMVNGIRSVIAAERAGLYPGGRKRRFSRYACIGGIAQLWVRRAFQCRQFRLAMMLLRESAPMIAAAGGKKLFSWFDGSPAALTLGGPEQDGPGQDGPGQDRQRQAGQSGDAEGGDQLALTGPGGSANEPLSPNGGSKSCR
jgi:glycosyltransferase involved in cell wall biosynthesis